MEMVERVGGRELHDTGGSRRLKTFLGLVALSFAVTLAFVVGNRLSEQALAVLAGAVCGVGAAIPTSLIIVSISRRQGQEPQEPLPAHQRGAYPQSAYPPVVVVTPQGGQSQHPSQSYGWNGLPPSLAPPTQREFTVVGEPPTYKESKQNGRYL